MGLDDGTPRSDGSQNATGEGGSITDASSENEVGGRKPKGCLQTDGAAKSRRVEARVKTTTKLKIGTWNVRSMSVGKLDIMKREMERTGICLLGVSEMKWNGMGHFSSEEYGGRCITVDMRSCGTMELASSVPRSGRAVC